MRAVVTFILLLVVAAVPVTADTVTPVAPRLPSGMTSGSALWMNDAMFVFGGYDWNAPDGAGRALDTIARYDPATGAVTVMDAKLPRGGWYKAAAWTGEKAYLFGGNGYTNWLRDVIEYDPATDTATVVAQLPIRVQGAVAAWSGTHVYLLGGDSPDELGAMFRFDPETYAVTRLPHSLPTGYGQFASGAWAHGAVYMFGGFSPDGSMRDILRVEPESGSVSVLPVKLRRDAWTPPVALDGTRFYVWDASTSRDEVLRFDALTGEVTVMPGRVPGARGVVAWGQGAAHAFTGAGCQPSSRCDQAYAYAPQDVVPRPEISLSNVQYSLWQAEDGSYNASFWIDVTVSGAPAYGTRLLVSPFAERAGTRVGDLVQLAPALQERQAIDWFQIPRHEVGTLDWLLYVLEDATPSPQMCVRMVADSGSTAYGEVSSAPVCAQLSSTHPAS